MHPEKLKRLSWFAYAAALLMWGVNGYSALYQLFVRNQLFEDVKNKSVTDFVGWYNGALVAAEAQKSQISIYDHALQLESLRRLLSPFVPNDDYLLDYPPPFFVLVRPMANLGLERAWILWCVVAIIPLAVALWALSKNIEGRFSRALFIIGAWASYPCWFAFYEGQTTLYQFPAHTAFWLLLRGGHFFAAGLVSSFISIKLQYAPLILLTGLIVGRLKFFIGLTIGCGVFYLGSALVLGWNNLLSYPAALIHGESMLTTGAVIMQNFRGQALLLLGGDTKLVRILSFCVYAVSLVAVGYVWSILYPRLKAKWGDLGFAACAAFSIACMLTASLHLHISDDLFAAALIAFLYPLVDRFMSARLSLLVKGLIIAFPFCSWFVVSGWVYLVIVRIQPFFLWSTVLLFVSTAQLWQMNSRQAEQ
jgi:hypothetical protein